VLLWSPAAESEVGAMTKVTIATVISCVLAVVLPGIAMAFDQTQLDQVKSTKACPGCALSGADLSGADLSGADLEGANLTGANLRANLEGANLEGAIGVDAIVAKRAAAASAKKIAAERAACLPLKAEAASDVVAQVLNYSEWGNDQGSTKGSFWYKAHANTCKYKICAHEDEETDIGIDLDSFDPKSISVGSRFLYYGRYEFSITHEGKTIISTSSSVDRDRLVRGWALIYRKYCKGTEKPF
jgi:hypothetical protein